MNHTINKDTAKQLKEIGYEMSLLLVEDDLVLIDQLKQFLSRFFGKVDIAKNGLEALEHFKKRPYDLVITDLTMPLMGGLELASKLRAINESQNIFIISAHSESEKLIELINIGIDGFLLKPVDINRVMVKLLKVCQAIYAHKMVAYFNNLLEETNAELSTANRELKSALDEVSRLKRDANSGEQQLPIRESEFITASQTSRALNDEEQMMLYTRSEKLSAIEFHTAYPFELDKTNEDLEILEDHFNLILMKADKSINHDILGDLIKILRNYAKVMELITQFGALAFGIQQLARTFESTQDPAKIQAIMPMLTLLFENLEQWRRGIFFYRNVEDIHYMDNSLISDALSLQGILDNEHASSDSDIELF